MAETTVEKPSKKVQLGTFSGVFMPSFLTIMGVIIFLRMGYVVGNTGLIHGLIIIGLANLISLLTGLSVSAVATNLKVKGGGDYYMISRSLGLEYGGPIGLILFLSQAVSVAFYIIGFAEVLVSMFPILQPVVVYIECFVCVGLFICACLDLDWAAKIQFWILVVLCFGLLAFLLGSLSHFDENLLKANMAPSYIGKNSFWIMFAIFFPAITGFTQGVSLSGDLKSPEKSIPRGTLTAVFLSLGIYLLFAVLVAGSTTRSSLLGNYMVMKEVAFFPFLIDLGVISATLSSSLTSFLGAPRILQALSRDHVFPFFKPFAKGYGPSDTPRRATFMTFLVAMACIIKGDLNTIAPIVTMFFLMTYGLMNYATFVEDFGNNPSFRPRFKYFHWRLSLAGAVGCLLAMLFINMVAALAAISFVLIIYWIVDKTVKETSWGDAKRGYYFSKIKDYLLRLRHEPFHAKNWRPQMLVLCGRPKSELALVKIGLWLEAGRGLLTLGHIIQGKLSERNTIRENEISSLDEFIKSNNLPVFGEVMVAPTFINGVESLLQAHSMGQLKPNTVVLGWQDHREKKATFIDVLQTIDSLGKNIVIIDEAEGLFDGKSHSGSVLKDLTIDVWWRGEKNGALMILLAYLWTQNPECRKGRIRLLRLVDKQEAQVQNEKHLRELVDSARMDAEVKVMVSSDPWTEVAAQESKNSDAVFVGLAVPEEGGEEAFLEIYEPMLEKLPTAVLVHCNEKIDIQL